MRFQKYASRLSSSLPTSSKALCINNNVINHMLAETISKQKKYYSITAKDLFEFYI